MLDMHLESSGNEILVIRKPMIDSQSLSEAIYGCLSDMGIDSISFTPY